jgi:hypothetical protein
MDVGFDKLILCVDSVMFDQKSPNRAI